jgi:hypothetical protein
LAVLVAALLAAQARLAASAAIVFDFEDGNQGWTLIGVERRAEPVLGGSYAMLGREFDRMWIEIDLTNVEKLRAS